MLITGAGADTAGQQLLRNTQKKVEIVRLTGVPEGSQFVLLTSKWNICYGFDKPSDFTTLRPFNSGNPYLFTAYGRYILGFQFVTLDKSELCVNDRAVDPDDDVDEDDTPSTTACDVCGNDPCTCD